MASSKSARVLLLVNLLLLSFLGVLADLRLLILHNNDMHSHFEEVSRTCGMCQKKGQCYGGFARIRRAVTDIRKKVEDSGERHVLFLNAGDNFQGTAYYSFFKWKVVAAFIDLLGIDVMSLGNHEFDDGPPGLAPYLHNITTLSVTANINITEEPTLYGSMLAPSTVITVNNTKIGIIGYLTPRTQVLEFTGKVRFSDEVIAINKEIEHQKQNGVNIFIALGHSGYETDMRIAKNCPDVDLVVGGHTNTFLYTGKPPDIEVPQDVYPKVVTQPSGKKVPVVQAYYYTKYLGWLEIDFDDKGKAVSYKGNPILLDSSYPEDEEILEKLEPYKEKLHNITSSIVGVTKVLLDHSHKRCHLRECNIGNMITDAMVNYNTKLYTGIGWTDAPIALVQGGGIRGSIDASATDGKITFADVLMVLPFQNILVKITVKGNVIKKILEFAVHRYEKTSTEQVGEFLSVSGLKVVYDVKAPSGSRVVSVKARCGNCSVPTYSDIHPDEYYGMIVSNYLVTAGDNYTVIRDNIYDKIPLALTDTRAVADYITQMSPIYPGITDRITFTTNTPSPTTSKPPESASSILNPGGIPLVICISISLMFLY